MTISLAGNRGEIVSSRKIVAEILHNLVDNAVKYNRPGGTVTVSVSEGEGEAALSVEDTGIGIPQEELPRIFERFYRVDKSHSRELGGTGWAVHRQARRGLPGRQALSGEPPGCGHHHHRHFFKRIPRRGRAEQDPREID